MICLKQMEDIILNTMPSTEQVISQVQCQECNTYMSAKI